MNRHRLFLAFFILFFAQCSCLLAEKKVVLRVLNRTEYIDINESLPDHLPIAQRSPSLLAFQKEFTVSSNIMNMRKQSRLLTRLRIFLVFMIF